MFSMHVCKLSSGLQDVLDTDAWKTYHTRLHEQYSLPEDEYKMFVTCRRQEELHYNINLKSIFCFLTLHNSFKLSAWHPEVFTDT